MLSLPTRLHWKYRSKLTAKPFVLNWIQVRRSALWPGRLLSECGQGDRYNRSDTVSLRDGSQLRILGYVMVLVSWNCTSRQLPIHVIEGEGPSLFGRDWLSAISIRVTGLQPPTNVHAFRTEVPFYHVDIPIAAPQPPPPAAGNDTFARRA